jgi:hypothetical protein
MPNYAHYAKSNAGIFGLTLEAGDEDEEEAGDDEEEDGSDEDNDAADLQNETEEEMTERYASIARDMAEGRGGGGDDEEEEGAEEEEDTAFESVLEPRHGDGTAAARAFKEWFLMWSKDTKRDDKMRVATLVDAAVLKQFQKCVPGAA